MVFRVLSETLIEKVFIAGNPIFYMNLCSKSASEEWQKGEIQNFSAVKSFKVNLSKS